MALIAALVMLVQFTAAQVAMAAPASAQTIEICTSHGKQTLTVDAAPGKQAPAPCSHCDHCVVPALTAAPALSVAIQPVRYATAASAARPLPALSPYAARAPPRPPGQGPPVSLNL